MYIVSFGLANPNALRVICGVYEATLCAGGPLYRCETVFRGPVERSDPDRISTILSVMMLITGCGCCGYVVTRSGVQLLARWWWDVTSEKKYETTITQQPSRYHLHATCIAIIVPMNSDPRIFARFERSSHVPLARILVVF